MTCWARWISPFRRIIYSSRWGETCAHYPHGDCADGRAIPRAVGAVSLMVGGGDEPFSEKYLTAIKLGTDPQSPGYWGNRPVRPASGGDGGLRPGAGAAGDKLTRRFSEREVMNLHAWLNQITDAQMPDSNWNYFAIMVQLGFKCAGLPHDPRAIDRRFAMMEAYYLGDGWWLDGPGRPKDYYISMAFHFYGLIYATLGGDEKRAEVLRERARQFAEDFIY